MLPPSPFAASFSGTILATTEAELALAVGSDNYVAFTDPHMNRRLGEEEQNDSLPSAWGTGPPAGNRRQLNFFKSGVYSSSVKIELVAKKVYAMHSIRVPSGRHGPHLSAPTAVHGGPSPTLLKPDPFILLAGAGMLK